ncbi:uncharacterized protein LOC134535573 [Bacillus rossius redtenbacheri]|uniref:uncharacterized protein LOC134535573 n=1 Tax=Bacillus rossius redtenbacheri TaxID=93214 RepID=UPI002FDCBBA8
MDSEEIALVVHMHLASKKKKKRRYWVHPMIMERRVTSLFHTLYPRIKEDEGKFFNFARMSLTTFEELLHILTDNLTRQDTNMRASIKPEYKIICTLRYLATGCSMTDLHYSYALGRSTIGVIVKEVCQEIWSCMKDMCIPQPTEENWLNIAAGFDRKANFPHCLGAIDGKHIRVIQPKQSGSLYYNYKKFFSIVLLAVCDADYMFTYVHIGLYGRTNDSSIFKQTQLYKRMVDGTLRIPVPAQISRTVNEIVPFLFIGDEAFGLSENMLRPYGGRNLSQKKKIFNYRLSRSRRYIECSFGILANKWRILHRPIDVDIELAEDIVKACCILHNFVRKRDSYKFEDAITTPDLPILERDNTSRGNHRALAVRDIFADYFINEEGELKWQYDMI